jgi:endonuclease YncB( thermonuclease family)
MRRLLLLFAALGLLLSAAPGEAQKNCSKGKPCGNTCIARNKVCRVGSGSARSAPRSPRSAPAAQAVSIPEGARYVASARGQVYYWTGCSAWKSLSRANLVWFEGAGEAAAAGYRPSASKGCAGPDGAVTTIAATQTEDAARSGVCVVAKVTDGDTVECGDGTDVRLLLIDTPELSQAPHGLAARAALLELLPIGTRARLELDVQERDRYGRVLAYLYHGGRMVNEEMARRGYALALVYPPNVRYVERIRAAVEQARAARRGLWAQNAFECTPKEHRAERC